MSVAERVPFTQARKDYKRETAAFMDQASDDMAMAKIRRNRRHPIRRLLPYGVAIAGFSVLAAIVSYETKPGDTGADVLAKGSGDGVGDVVGDSWALVGAGGEIVGSVGSSSRDASEAETGGLSITWEGFPIGIETGTAGSGSGSGSEVIVGGSPDTSGDTDSAPPASDEQSASPPPESGTPRSVTGVDSLWQFATNCGLSVPEAAAADNDHQYWIGVWAAAGSVNPGQADGDWQQRVFDEEEVWNCP